MTGREEMANKKDVADMLLIRVLYSTLKWK